MRAKEVVQLGFASLERSKTNTCRLLRYLVYNGLGQELNGVKRFLYTCAKS